MMKAMKISSQSVVRSISVTPVLAAAIQEIDVEFTFRFQICSDLLIEKLSANRQCEISETLDSDSGQRSGGSKVNQKTLSRFQASQGEGLAGRNNLQLNSCSNSVTLEQLEIDEKDQINFCVNHSIGIDFRMCFSGRYSGNFRASWRN